MAGHRARGKHPSDDSGPAPPGEPSRAAHQLPVATKPPNTASISGPVGGEQATA